MFKKLILRKLILVITILVCFFCETSFSQIFSMYHTFPNLLLMITAFVGFLCGRREGIYAGLLSGFLLDCFSGSTIGFNTLLFMYIGFVNGLFKRMYYDEDALTPIALVSISDLAYHFIYFVFNFMVRNKMELGYYFPHIILPEILFTIIVTLVAYPVFMKVNKKLLQVEKGSETLLD